MLEGGLEPKQGAVAFLSTGRTVLSRLRFTDALLTHVRFPALDGASQCPARLQVKLSPAGTQRTTKGAGSPGPASPKIKSLLASNFRLSIDGLDCSRVSRIEALTVTATMDDQRQPAALEVSDLVVTTSFDAAGVDDWHQWHEASVVAGKAVEKQGRLELLDPSLKSASLTLTLTGLGIHALIPDLTTGDGGVSRQQARMYCEQVALR